MCYEEEILERAERLGALTSGVSGNGPSLFAITKEGNEGPIVEEFSKHGEVLGALASGVSGNGPSLFAITKEGDEGPIVEEFSKHGEVRVVELVSHGSLGRTFKG